MGQSESEDEDLFLARLCDWSYITMLDNPAAIDGSTVQGLIESSYGSGWQVETGTTSSWPGTVTEHLPYMIVYSVTQSSTQLSQCILVFKGSNSFFKDWYDRWDALKDYFLVDLNGFPRLPYPFHRDVGGSDQLVHRGFYQAWQASMSIVRDHVRRVMDRFEDPRRFWNLRIAGHSLGASLAQFAWIEFVNQAYTSGYWRKVVRLYACTFGAPLIGNAGFWSSAEQLVTLTRPRSYIDIGARFYESDIEVFGAKKYPDEFPCDQRTGHIGIYHLFDQADRFAASSVFRKVITTDPDWGWRGSWGIVGTHKIKTYIDVLRKPYQEPNRNIADVRSWDVVVRLVGPVDPTLSRANFRMWLTYPSTVTDEHGQHIAITTLVDLTFSGLPGSSVSLHADGQVLTAQNDFKLRFNAEQDIRIGAIIIYTDGRESWRQEEMTISSGDSGDLNLRLSGF